MTDNYDDYEITRDDVPADVELAIVLDTCAALLVRVVAALAPDDTALIDEAIADAYEPDDMPEAEPDTPWLDRNPDQDIMDMGGVENPEDGGDV